MDYLFCYTSYLKAYPVDTRRRFNVYTTSLTSYRRCIDVETTSCVYWVDSNTKKLRVKILQDKKKTCKGNIKLSRHRHNDILMNQVTPSEFM